MIHKPGALVSVKRVDSAGTWHSDRSITVTNSSAGL